MSCVDPALKLQDNNVNMQTQHDLLGAIRFLENLYEEILHTDDLHQLKDPLILKRFQENIALLKDNFKI